VYTTTRRVVTQSDWYTPPQPLLQSLHWLPVQQRLVYKAALITYKVITTSTPSYLNDLLAVHIPAGPTLRSSTRPLLTVPYVASNFARRSFCFVSPTVWNTLPSDVQSSSSQATFNSRLKTHLFNIAFNDEPELWCCVTFSAPQDLWHWHLARYKLDYYYYYYWWLCDWPYLHHILFWDEWSLGGAIAIYRLAPMKLGPRTREDFRYDIHTTLFLFCCPRWGNSSSCFVCYTKLLATS